VISVFVVNAGISPSLGRQKEKKMLRFSFVLRTNKNRLITVANLITPQGEGVFLLVYISLFPFYCNGQPHNDDISS